jgi:autoinducer 2 (AI-2) kinase
VKHLAKTYLVFDLGTGNSKVALVTSAREILDLKSVENEYGRDKEYVDAQFFLPEEWKNKLLNLCAELLAAHPEESISGITASGARESIVLYNTDGKAFLGLPNIDNRGRQWIGAIPDQEYIYEKTGRWVTEDFVAAKLLGLQKKHPEKYDHIAKMTSLSEWIGEIFTGNMVIEPSQACETQLYDIDAMAWSKRLCDIYGVKMTLLPQVQNAGTLLGGVTPDIAQKLGISPDTPFIVGGADTQVAVKSTGCYFNDIAITSGTTSPVTTILDHKFYDAQERCWVDCNLAGKGYQIETNPGVTGLNYQRFKNKFLPKMSYDEIEDALKAKKSFLCTASFSSLLFSKRKSLRVGGFVMNSPFSVECDIIDLTWALLADISCSIYEQYRNLCEMIPHTKAYILGCGGGFRSTLLCQMLSDLTGKELMLYHNYETASIIGCAELCNDYFGIENTRQNWEKARYVPNGDELIHLYYDVWSKNRMLLNK